MKHMHSLEKEPEEITEAGAYGISLRTLIGNEDGAPNFYMRMLSFDTGASSPEHAHPWEHEAFILSGSGELVINGEKRQLKQGDVVFIPPGSEHCFRSDEGMEMI